MTERRKQIIQLMTPRDFEARVRDYSRFGHMVRILDHVTADNADRQITRPLIIRALQKGQVLGMPKWDSSHGTWVGKMRRIGTGIDLTVVCAIQDGVLTVTVVTVYGQPK